MTTNQTSKRQCKVITIQEKLAMLRKLEAGFSRREVSDMFKCSQSTISRVLSEKEGIVKDAEDNVHGKRENLLYYKELDRALSQWATEMKNSDVMITASMARKKAEELALVIGLELKPSTGWLYKWRERENITFVKRTNNPEEILKECYEKEQRLLQMRTDHLQKSKRMRMEEETIITEKAADKQEDEENEKRHGQVITDENNETRSSTTIKQQEEGKEQNPVGELNAESNEIKPRTKREYIKRLPIIDASGAICRSRKEKTFLTLLQKLEILERLRNGEKRPDLTVEYNLSSSAMSQIITDEEKILKLAAEGQNLHMKRIRGGIFRRGEAELNAWVQEKLEMDESLTRTHVKNKAKEIAERLNIEFKASTGWLEKWKVRMNLDFNENQKLHRKLPKLIPSGEEIDNSQAQFELSDSFYDEQDCEIMQMPVKEEQMENGYCDDMETGDGFLSNDMAEVKPELLTPQQFYLQTIRTHTQTLYSSYDKQAEHLDELKSIEEPDTKPLLSTPPHVSTTNHTEFPHSQDNSNDMASSPEIPFPQSVKNSRLSNASIRPKFFAQERNFDHNRSNTPSAETLHEQVLLWLNQYNIPPRAASELLNILQPHLNSAAKSCADPVQRNINFF